MSIKYIHSFIQGTLSSLYKGSLYRLHNEASSVQCNLYKYTLYRLHSKCEFNSVACIGPPYTGYTHLLSIQCSLHRLSLYRPPFTILLFWLHRVACIVGAYTAGIKVGPGKNP